MPIDSNEPIFRIGINTYKIVCDSYWVGYTNNDYHWLSVSSISQHLEPDKLYLPVAVRCYVFIHISIRANACANRMIFRFAAKLQNDKYINECTSKRWSCRNNVNSKKEKKNTKKTNKTAVQLYFTSIFTFQFVLSMIRLIFDFSCQLLFVVLKFERIFNVVVIALMHCQTMNFNIALIGATSKNILGLTRMLYWFWSIHFKVQNLYFFLLFRTLRIADGIWCWISQRCEKQAIKCPKKNSQRLESKSTNDEEEPHISIFVEMRMCRLIFEWIWVLLHVWLCQQIYRFDSLRSSQWDAQHINTNIARTANASLFFISFGFGFFFWLSILLLLLFGYLIYLRRLVMVPGDARQDVRMRRQEGVREEEYTQCFSFFFIVSASGM